MSRLALVFQRSLSRSAAALFLSFCTPTSTSPPGVGTPQFDRVITIVLENTSYPAAMQQSYLLSLTQKGALLSNFSDIGHPSQPNYIAMAAGDPLGVADDSNSDLNQASIADLLEAKSLTWKAYAEGYPGNCFLGATSGRYARKHVPFVSFTSIQQDSARCPRIVAGTQFQTDWTANSLPNYSFYVPNLDNDGHDTGVDFAANWLKGFLDPLLADATRMAGTLIIVTFDEGAGIFDQIYTVLLGPMVVAGQSDSTPHNSYSLLKLIEGNFGLGNLGRGDASAPSITGIWAP